MALCRRCSTVIPCHCHLTPPTQIRPGVYTDRNQETTVTTDQQLDEYETAVAAYQQHPALGFACCSAHPASDADAALVVEVRRLRAQVAELQEAQRLEWTLMQAHNPHTPRLCECGHSHHAHTVPAPHGCFAYGKTCPCEAYRQLPHDQAVAQLETNRQAAAERESALAAAGSAAANEDGR
ncbi:hypothetical protein [Streptomyces sp. NK08204]|uniref:hypothetical protein n=1 Tax=Streptomyces sp. NK08204 TaxID=2873260 RepID=UPI001CEC6575|nr:hypothetical protein [Streptomyces sp. NK08204]